MYTVPRIIDGVLVKNDQMAGVYETLATKQRQLFLYGAIVGAPDRVDNWNPFFIADEMIAMSLDDPKTPIVLHIDSPGGSVRDGLRLIDILRTVEAPVWTVGSACYSMGAIILAAGEPGHRYVYPNAHTMLHLPAGRAQGDAKQIEIQNKEMQKVKKILVERIREWGVSKGTRTVLKDIDREFYLNAEETIKYGLADKLVVPSVFRGVDDTPEG